MGLDPPAGASSDWDADGVSITLPGPAIRWRDIFLGVLALWALSAAFIYGLAQWKMGLFTATQFRVVLSLPLLFFPMLAAGRVIAAKRPIVVRLEPMGRLRFEWAGSEVPLVVRFADLRGVSADLETPSVCLDVEPGTGHGPTVKLRVATPGHAAWLAGRIEEGLRLRDRRRGAATDVPDALRDLAGRSGVHEPA